MTNLNNEPVIQSVSEPVLIDPKIALPEPAAASSKPEQTEEEELNTPLTEAEAAKVREAAILGYYSGRHSISCRTYVLRTITSADKKKWKATFVVTMAKTRSAYAKAEPPVFLSDVDLEVMCSDDNTQRYLAYQILEIDGNQLTYEQALSHVEKMSPIERSYAIGQANANDIEYGKLVARSVRTGLKKS